MKKEKILEQVPGTQGKDGVKSMEEPAKKGALEQTKERRKEQIEKEVALVHTLGKDSLLEKQAIYRLMSQPGMYSGRLRKLQKLAGGSFAAVFGKKKALYLQEGIFRTEKEADAFLEWHSKPRTEQLLERFQKDKARGVRMTAEWEDEYPKRLSVIPDRPAMLFVRGNLPNDDIPSAAIIGARACSQYGEDTAAYFAAELARNGVQIVSGLAEGIDLAASRGALSEKGSGESFGVLGSGVFVCYPKESYPCYRRMCEGAGGVLSEYPPSSPALGFHFILRNRIIAGLCDVLLVMEAREKSGTAITVEYALLQGKDVFALPGRITDPLGRGCNALLKDGAMVLTEPNDVLDTLKLPYAGEEKTKRGGTKTRETAATRVQLKKSFLYEKKSSALAKSEKLVYSCLDFNAKHIEELARQSGLSLSGTISALAALVQKGYAVSPQSAYYRKAYQ